MASNLPPARQLFSVPYNFILYMAEKPASAKGLEKLQQTCKFFFDKIQVFISHFLVCSEKGYSYKDNVVQSIKTNAKFWAASYLSLHWNFDPTKFYRISVKILYIEKVALSRSEFDFLVAENTIERFHLSNSKIENVTLDEIVEKLSTAVNFWYKNQKEIYSVETLQKLNAIQRKPKLKLCGFKISKFEDFSETEIPPLFLQFMLQNSTSKSRFFFQFEPPASQLKSTFFEAFQKWGAENPNKVNVVAFPHYVSVTFK